MIEADVLITEALTQRSPRAPDWETENRVLRALGRQFSQPPAVILKHFTAIACDLCQADTAGVSLLETLPEGTQIFRWVAISGSFEAAEGGTVPRDFSPCGSCLDQGFAQLYQAPARYFTYLQAVELAIVEALVLPLYAEGQAIGTIWVVTQDPKRQFDSEDLRLMTSLADFLGAALANAQLRQTLTESLEREQKSHDLTTAAQKINMILESMPNAFAAYDREWRYTYVNAHATRILQKSRSDLLGQPVWQLFPKSIGTIFYQELHRAVAAQVAVKFEYFSTTIQSWFEVHAYPTPDGIAVYFQDISDRKRIEVREQQAAAEREQLLQQLAAERARFETVIHQMPEGVIIADAASGELVLSNEQAQQILRHTFELNLPLAEYENRVPFQAYRTDQSLYEPEEYPLARSLQRGEVVIREEMELRYPDGQRKMIEAHASPILNHQGEIISAVTVFQDITARKQTEFNLQESQHFVQQIAETTPGILYVYDLVEQCNVYLNQQVTQILGYTVEQVRAMGPNILPTLIHPDDFAQIPAHLARFAIAQDNEVLELEYRMHHANGEWRWFAGREVIFSRTAEGAPHCILGIAQDITDRKQAEADLRESEERFRAIFSQAAVGINQVCLDQRFIFVNSAYCEMTGYSMAELQRLSWQDITHPDDVQADLNQTQRLLAGDIDHYNLEKRYIHKNGSIVWVNLASSVVRDQLGQAKYTVGVIQNISDRKQTELEREQLSIRERQHAQQLQGLTTASLKINVALSLKEVLELITHQAAAIIGTHQAVTSLTVNQNWAQAINAIYLSDKYAPWRDYAAKPDGSGIYACVCHTNQPVRLTQAELEAHPHWRGFGPHATDHPPLRGWLAAPLTDREGQNLGLIQLSDKLAGDFTEADEAILMQLAQLAAIAIENARLYKAEQEARAIAEASREEAEAANRIKDEFLAVLSHELRSPLNPILGWVKLLRNGKLDPQKTAYALETIERNAKLQTQLIEDLLDVSRILQGKLNLTMQPVNLVTTIAAALETVQLAAEAKAIDLRLTTFGFTSEAKAAKPNFLVLGDSARLQQIVWNLLSNAVKFTDRGGQVEVQLAVLADEDRPPLKRRRSAARASSSYAQITVTDTGKGISPNFLPHVFEYFRQADSTITRQFGGLGLGLAIVRHLVELHGGTVHATSLGEGQGASFTVKLPLIKQPHHPRQTLPNQTGLGASQASPLAQTRILLVDDHTDTRDFISFTLEQHQAIITAVSSATEALTLLQQYPFDLLISDVGMPDMDGYTLMQQIRTLPPHQGGTIPAIALTAYAGDFNQQQALLAGFQTHLAKPAEPEALITLLVSLLQQDAIATQAIQPISDP